ncbi:MAG TPA: hypothetical protein DE315_01015 [Candidatus Omnitrophica bacterium]|nr:hypothetical protein [Candidatus Omnitrophota bacterium]HCI44104.1 hypothetical protein [Candidatus Omnitrophota bacterium]
MANSRFRKYAEMAVTALCVVFMVCYFSRNTHFFAKLPDIDLKVVFFLCILNIFIHLVTAYKFLYLLRRLGLKGASDFAWTKIFTIARFLNYHITQAAHLYRAVALKRQYNLSYTNSIAVLALLSWIESIVNCLIAFILIFAVFPGFRIKDINVSLILGSVLLTIAFLPFVGERILRITHFRNRSFAWLHAKFTDMTRSFAAAVRDRATLLVIFSYSLLIFMLNVTAIDFSFQAIGIHLTVSQTVLFTVLIMLGSIINITPSNIGVVEMLSGYLSQQLGFTLGDGILACGIFRIVGYILVALATVFFYKDLSLARREIAEYS